MIGEAFCPAHLTGFFTIRKNNNVQETGSLGAGFSIRLGVNTSVEIEFDATPGMQIQGFICNGSLDTATCSEHFSAKTVYTIHFF